MNPDCCTRFYHSFHNCHTYLIFSCKHLSLQLSLFTLRQATLSKGRSKPWQQKKEIFEIIFFLRALRLSTCSRDKYILIHLASMVSVEHFRTNGSQGYHLAECRCVALGQVPFMALDQVVSWWGHLTRCRGSLVTFSSAYIHLAKCTKSSIFPSGSKISLLIQS